MCVTAAALLRTQDLGGREFDIPKKTHRMRALIVSKYKHTSPRHMFSLPSDLRLFFSAITVAPIPIASYGSPSQKRYARRLSLFHLWTFFKGSPNFLSICYLAFIKCHTQTGHSPRPTAVPAIIISLGIFELFTLLFSLSTKNSGANGYSFEAELSVDWASEWWIRPSLIPTVTSAFDPSIREKCLHKIKIKRSRRPPLPSLVSCLTSKTPSRLLMWK